MNLYEKAKKVNDKAIENVQKLTKEIKQVQSDLQKLGTAKQNLEADMVIGESGSEKKLKKIEKKQDELQKELASKNQDLLQARSEASEASENAKLAKAEEAYIEHAEMYREKIKRKALKKELQRLIDVELKTTYTGDTQAFWNTLGYENERKVPNNSKYKEFARKLNKKHITKASEAGQKEAKEIIDKIKKML